MLISRLSCQVPHVPHPPTPLSPCLIRRGEREIAYCSSVLMLGQALCWVPHGPDVFQCSHWIFFWRMKTQRHREVSSLAQGHTAGGRAGAWDALILHRCLSSKFLPWQLAPGRTGGSDEVAYSRGGSILTPEKKKLSGKLKLLWPSFKSQNTCAELCCRALMTWLMNVASVASTVSQADPTPVFSPYSQANNRI